MKFVENLLNCIIAHVERESYSFQRHLSHVSTLVPNSRHTCLGCNLELGSLTYVSLLDACF